MRAASDRRCVKLRLETRALFGPIGSIVDRGPCGVPRIAVAKAVEPGPSCVAVARATDDSYYYRGGVLSNTD